MKTNIQNITFEPCQNSPYISPMRMHYTENGIAKTWDFIKSLDSVAIILHRRDLDCLVIVRQFRPPVFAQGRDGYTYELCAGLIDKPNKTIEQIAAEEALEECGYAVDSQNAQNFRQIAVFHNSVGTSGAKQHIFYASVCAENLVAQGGGVDGEIIECELIKRENLLEFLSDESKPKTPGLGFGILWFLQNIKK